MDKIAIKLTIRNEDDFLDEWFQYYISFFHPILFDKFKNNIKDNLIINYSF